MSKSRIQITKLWLLIKQIKITNLEVKKFVSSFIKIIPQENQKYSIEEAERLKNTIIKIAGDLQNKAILGVFRNKQIRIFQTMINESILLQEINATQAKTRYIENFLIDIEKISIDEFVEMSLRKEKFEQGDKSRSLYPENINNIFLRLNDCFPKVERCKTQDDILPTLIELIPKKENLLTPRLLAKFFILTDYCRFSVADAPDSAGGNGAKLTTLANAVFMARVTLLGSDESKIDEDEAQRQNIEDTIKNEINQKIQIITERKLQPLESSFEFMVKKIYSFFFWNTNLQNRPQITNKADDEIEKLRRK
jgi:hypothetical protein